MTKKDREALLEKIKNAEYLYSDDYADEISVTVEDVLGSDVYEELLEALAPGIVLVPVELSDEMEKGLLKGLHVTRSGVRFNPVESFAGLLAALPDKGE